LANYYNPDWKEYDLLIKALIAAGEEDSIKVAREPHDHEFFTFTEIVKLPLRTLDKVKDVR